MSDRTVEQINQFIVERIVGGCWHDDKALEFADKAPPDGWFQCECGVKSFTLPFDENPDYCSPQTPRYVLDEVVAKVVEKVGRLNYLRFLADAVMDTSGVDPEFVWYKLPTATPEQIARAAVAAIETTEGK